MTGHAVKGVDENSRRRLVFGPGEKIEGQMARFEIHATFAREDGERDSDCLHTVDKKAGAIAFCESVMADPKACGLTVTDVSAWVVDTRTNRTIYGA